MPAWAWLVLGWVLGQLTAAVFGVPQL